MYLLDTNHCSRIIFGEPTLIQQLQLHTEAGEYQLLEGEPVWLANINLGIGREEGTYQGVTREWLYWYDKQGKRYLTPEETISDTQQQLQSAENRAVVAEEQLEQVRQRTKRLAQLLREAGIDPDEN